MRTLLTGFVLWIASSLSAFATTSVPVDTGKVVASILTDHYEVVPGQDFTVALKTKLDDKWHTYWRNPGDSGEPVSIRWSLPDGVSVSEITWPLPAPIDTGGIINYGFEGEPLFPQTLSVSEDVQLGTRLDLVADVYYLVCKDICIPEDGQLSLSVMVGGTAEINPSNMAEIDAAFQAAPQSNDTIRGSLTATDTALTMEFTDLPEGDFSDAYFFPYAQDIVNHSEPQRARVVDGGVVIETVEGFGWANGISDTQTGVLAFEQNGTRVGQIITVEPNMSFGLAVGGSSIPIAQIGLFTALLGAFVGGLILNLMPCVFPVISLKALSLAKSAHAERAQARSEAWMYALGILATFAILVAVMLVLKAGGEAIGWGFQMQNPVIVGLLALLLFAVGLNLIGAYEVSGGSYQSIGAGASMRSGRAGSFFTGSLAVIVATPCTAPFMGAAMGYTLTQPVFITMIVFGALAAGFAAPFVLLTYAPGLLAKLPKPGPWMVRLREVLSFPMFAASIWLVWVIGGQTGPDGMFLILLAMVGLGLAIWLVRRKSRIWKGAALGVVALMVALPAYGLSVLGPVAKTDAASVDGVQIAKEAWSPERVAELRAQGRAVFVDFTADWCVTCKVNEGAVLNTKAVKEALEETNTAFLVADWTNKDDRIARELAAYGRAGVPLYLYFPSSEGGSVDNSVKGEVLPQLLTVDRVVNTLRGS